MSGIRAKSKKLNKHKMINIFELNITERKKLAYEWS